jgi:hypothetical protein
LISSAVKTKYQSVKTDMYLVENEIVKSVNHNRYVNLALNDNTVNHLGAEKPIIVPIS